MKQQDKSNRPQTYLSTPDLPIHPRLTYRPVRSPCGPVELYQLFSFVHLVHRDVHRATPAVHDHVSTPYKRIIGGSKGGGGYGGYNPTPFQISKIKEGNKTKQKIEDNPLEKDEERKSCMFV